MGSPKGFHLQTSASPPGWAGAEEGGVCIPECVCPGGRKMSECASPSPDLSTGNRCGVRCAAVGAGPALLMQQHLEAGCSPHGEKGAGPEEKAS